MNESKLPPKHLNTDFIPVDGDVNARSFLGLDKAKDVASTLHSQKDFISSFEQSAGLRETVSTDLQGISRRAREHNLEATGRRPLNTAAKVAIGAAIVGSVLYMNGKDLEHDRNLAEYDQKNKEENIANNPDLFGQDLPQDPTETTVTVEQ